MFPSCLQWIIDNQLTDGSWGEEILFCIYDRLLNTLACVVALTLWNICLHKRNKDIDIPYDSPVLKDIYARREVKITRIPKDVIHIIPTTVLFSLEGLRDDLDWQRLLKLQMADGSFLTSPASTAFAFMETNDEKCLAYLQNVVEKCNGGDALNNFKDGDQFFCQRGEVDGSATHMFNLYRCSQVLFPGEKILEEAKNFTYNFLQQCLANNQCLDKWVIAKDIPGEIRYALEFPWYASLPRVEARLYIEQYGGADDLWIGKTLFRMPISAIMFIYKLQNRITIDVKVNIDLNG
ncbi:copal-8-ol diphosphate hydratase, chloroplastic-like [Nicotiana sylvestris]|uniref:copal-8-ol diphosphate hydratase, chloroplastic-like n=1 Tax=Nicotiana sylvestris TaxID=4096 RepID=UPI00388C3810